MTSTYHEFSAICSAFYDLVVEPERVAEFILSRLKPFAISTGLFVGSFFQVARCLIDRGLVLTVCDYANAMVVEGRKRLPAVDILQADLRALPFPPAFDGIFVIGRVFTHMLTEGDARRALDSLQHVLRPGGVLLFDNYEATRIRATAYFNGQVRVGDANHSIIRTSSTQLISERPFVVNWRAAYQVFEPGRERSFQDEMPHRAFSRPEIRALVEAHGLRVIEQGDNFDETSFYTVALKTA